MLEKIIKKLKYCKVSMLFEGLQNIFQIIINKIIFLISLINLKIYFNHISNTFQSIVRFLYSKSPNSRPGNSLSE